MVAAMVTGARTRSAKGLCKPPVKNSRTLSWMMSKPSETVASPFESRAGWREEDHRLKSTEIATAARAKPISNSKPSA